MVNAEVLNRKYSASKYAVSAPHQRFRTTLNQSSRGASQSGARRIAESGSASPYRALNRLGPQNLHALMGIDADQIAPTPAIDGDAG